MNIAVVLDASASADPSKHAKVQDAASGFLNAITGTGANAALVEFGSTADVPVAYLPITTENIASYFDYYIYGAQNPHYNDGQLGVGSNWEAAFKAINNLAVAPDMVVFISDGLANTLGNGGEVASLEAALDAARASANITKTNNGNLGNGSHILAINVGDSAYSSNFAYITNETPTAYDATNFASSDYELGENLQLFLQEIPYIFSALCPAAPPPAQETLPPASEAPADEPAPTAPSSTQSEPEPEPIAEAPDSDKDGLPDSEDPFPYEAPTVQTDLPDYKPADTAIITGYGWVPGEKVTLQVVHISEYGPLYTYAEWGNGHEPWTVVADANGEIYSTWYVDPDDSDGAFFLLTAEGESGLRAENRFSDNQPAVSLEQCRNGGAGAPQNCSGSAWQNGNVNAIQAHMVEGYSVPYRAVMTNLPLNTPITLTLGYDIKHSGKHALDYLTHYQRLEPHQFQFGHTAETVFPKSNALGDGEMAGLSATTSTYSIPVPSTANSPKAGQPATSFLSLPGAERVFTLFGGTITDITYAAEGNLNASQSETRISVTFTVDSETAILAWGGHIARCEDWGIGPDGKCNSAAGVTGSPYHMRTIGWNLNNLGNQDRSLAATAVVPTGKVIVKKVCNPTTETQSFNFTSTNGSLPGTFSIGCGQQVQYDSVLTGNKSISESTTPSGWSFTSANCVDQNQQPKGSLTGQTVNFDLLVNETVTCTFTNTKQNPAMTVEKSSATTSLSAPGLVTYSYLVTNTGNITLTGISLVDDNDEDDISCPSTTLAVGANMTCSATHNFTQAELDANGSPVADSGVLFNNVTASSNEAPHATDDLSIPIVHISDIVLIKSASQSPIDAGQTATFSITVTNNGPGRAYNVTLTDPLPAGLSWVEDSANCSISSNILSCNFGTMLKDASFTVVLTAPTTAANCGSLENTATVSASNEPLANQSNNSSSASINVGCGSITAKKYEDKNGNGAYDAGESYLSNWTIFIDGNGNSTLDQGEQSAVTDANGSVSFSNIAPGQYSVCEVLKANWFNSEPGGGAVCRNVTVVTGQQASTIFGNYRYATKSGYKFYDHNADGIFNAGSGVPPDEKRPGWKIYLHDLTAQSAPVQVITDVNGNYAFGQLVPGHNYAVCEEDQTDGSFNWAQSPMTAPAGEFIFDCKTLSAGYMQNGYGFTATSGANFANNNFGNYLVPPGCTLTQGYWKTHSKYGPAKKADATWDLVNETLTDADDALDRTGPDALFFDSGLSWITVFNTTPKGGNAWYQLAHQYMAAVLSQLSGAGDVPGLASTLSQAYALLDAYDLAKDIKPKADRTKALQLAAFLDAYNNGLKGIPHCGEAPTSSSTAISSTVSASQKTVEPAAVTTAAVAGGCDQNPNQSASTFGFAAAMFALISLALRRKRFPYSRAIIAKLKAHLT